MRRDSLLQAIARRFLLLFVKRQYIVVDGVRCDVTPAPRWWPRWLT